MQKEKLIEFWEAEEQYAFEGWDFSHLKGRLIEDALPWDYKQEIESYLNPSHKILDMGTGGGEFLLSLHHPYENTYVTEAYEPNIKLCLKKLKPLGITVHGLDSDHAKLPFQDGSMDMILNRHEYFDSREVYRILKPGGIFITQQVGPLNNQKLSSMLIGNMRSREACDNDFKDMVTRVSSQGFKIVKSQECFPKQRFLDIGGLVYFAKIISWEFPGFTVRSCLDRLLMLQEQLEKDGYIEGDEHRYVIIAKKDR